MREQQRENSFSRTPAFYRNCLKRFLHFNVLYFTSKCRRMLDENKGLKFGVEVPIPVLPNTTTWLPKLLYSQNDLNCISELKWAQDKQIWEFTRIELRSCLCRWLLSSILVNSWICLSWVHFNSSQSWSCSRLII